MASLSRAAFPARANRDPLAAKGTALRLGPCDPGGVSPSTLFGLTRVTGSIFTGPGLSPPSSPQSGFFEPGDDGGDAPASSGPTRSLELTKAPRGAVPFALQFVARPPLQTEVAA